MTSLRRIVRVVLVAFVVMSTLLTASGGIGAPAALATSGYSYDSRSDTGAAITALAQFKPQAGSAATTPTFNVRTATLVARRATAAGPRSSTPASTLRRATKAGEGVAQRTVTALTREQDSAVNAVMRDSNRLEHIFGQGGKHNLGQLTQELGGQQAVVRASILRVPRTQPEGVFKLSSRIGPHPVTMTGRMMNGVPRISNVWVPR